MAKLQVFTLDNLEGGVDLKTPVYKLAQNQFQVSDKMLYYANGFKRKRGN